MVLRCLDSHTVRMDLSSSFLILTTHSVKSSRWSGCEILKFLVGKSCNDLVPAKPFWLRPKPQGTEKLVNWFSSQWKMVVQRRIPSNREEGSPSRRSQRRRVENINKGLLRLKPDRGPSVGSERQGSGHRCTPLTKKLCTTDICL